MGDENRVISTIVSVPKGVKGRNSIGKKNAARFLRRVTNEIVAKDVTIIPQLDIKQPNIRQAAVIPQHRSAAEMTALKSIYASKEFARRNYSNENINPEPNCWPWVRDKMVAMGFIRRSAANIKKHYHDYFKVGQLRDTPLRKA